MKTFVTLALLSVVTTISAAEWKPTDIHPKVFQMIDCWLSDTISPVITEINLDAVRSNRNQFDYDLVKKESKWVTFREDREMLRFSVLSSTNDEYTVLYQENGGGSLTTQRVIQFAISPRSVKVDGNNVTTTVLHLTSISIPK